MESIDADHRQMTKFADKGDPGYRAIAGVLKQFIRSGLHNVVSKSAYHSSMTFPRVGEQTETAVAESGAVARS